LHKWEAKHFHYKSNHRFLTILRTGCKSKVGTKWASAWNTPISSFFLNKRCMRLLNVLKMGSAEYFSISYNFLLIRCSSFLRADLCRFGNHSLSNRNYKYFRNMVKTKIDHQSHWSQRNLFQRIKTRMTA
jgi:hypothetical protein